MPNWCYTSYTAYSKDKSVLEDFQSKVDDWVSRPTLDKDAWNENPAWLGNILLHSGFSSDDILSDNDEFRCRGELLDTPAEILQSDGWYFTDFATETAWGPMPEMWLKIFKKLYPDTEIRLAFSAEECGMSVYLKHDPDKLFYRDEYYIDSYLEAGTLKQYPQVAVLEDRNSDYTEEDAVKLLKEVLCTESSDIDFLIKSLDELCEDFDDDSYIHCYKYEEYFS